MAGKIFIISGPSGCGKTTLVKSLFASWQKGEHELARVITFTTRPPRPQEQDGIDYHFITDEEFKAWQQAGFFLETSYFCGYWYGSPVSIIDTALKGDVSFIIILDQEGVQALKGREGIVTIRVLPPSEQELMQRLQHRDGANNKRSETALQEFHDTKITDFFDHQLLNDDLKTAVIELKSVILSSIK